MKKSKSTATIQREARLNGLIRACLEHFSEDEMIEAFNEVCETDYKEQTEEEAMKDLHSAGYLIFKPLYSYQGDQLVEYAENHVFTTYNDQMVAIPFR